MASKTTIQKLIEAVKSLTNAANLVINRWESGDLAEAVRNLDMVVECQSGMLETAEKEHAKEQFNNELMRGDAVITALVTHLLNMNADGISAVEKVGDTEYLVNVSLNAAPVVQQPTINKELLEACIQARAALPDAWAAVQCDIPKEVIELLNRVIERAESVEPTPINLAIVLDGGLVQTVVTDAPEAFKGINTMIIDYDVDAPSVEDNTLGIIPQSDGGLTAAYIQKTFVDRASIDLSLVNDFIKDRRYGSEREPAAVSGENPCEGCKDCNSDSNRCVNEDKCLAWQYYNEPLEEPVQCDGCPEPDGEPACNCVHCTFHPNHID